MVTNDGRHNGKDRSVGALIGGIFGSIYRTTVRFIKNIPSKVTGYVKRRINEYKRRPKRTEMNRVYVLVGYTTRKHIDRRYNAEKYLMILRRGLLLLIFILLIFISINAILPYVRVEQYRQMFGLGEAEEMTERDPFGSSAAVSSGETGPQN